MENQSSHGEPLDWRVTRSHGAWRCRMANDLDGRGVEVRLNGSADMVLATKEERPAL